MALRTYTWADVLAICAAGFIPMAIDTAVLETFKRYPVQLCTQTPHIDRFLSYGAPAFVTITPLIFIIWWLTTPRSSSPHEARWTPAKMLFIMTLIWGICILVVPGIFAAPWPRVSCARIRGEVELLLPKGTELLAKGRYEEVLEQIKGMGFVGSMVVLGRKAVESS